MADRREPARAAHRLTGPFLVHDGDRAEAPTPGRAGASMVVLVWVIPAYACSPPGARMPRPFDPTALKGAADRIATLLNDLRRDGWELGDRGLKPGLEVTPAGGPAEARAVVTDDASEGRWRTTDVQIPVRLRRESLADRLRALAAEVEAL